MRCRKEFFSKLHKNPRVFSLGTSGFTLHSDGNRTIMDTTMCAQELSREEAVRAFDPKPSFRRSVMEHFNPILGSEPNGQKFITCGEIMLRQAATDVHKH